LGIFANGRSGTRTPDRRRARTSRANLAGGEIVDESKQRAIRFLEKELKTYMALSRFFLKKGIREQVRVGEKKVLISPSFYKERMKEAKRLVNELRKSD
jgi:hypothetical protein